MATSLEDFVAVTLEEIIAGVHRAQMNIFEEYAGAHINPFRRDLGAKVVDVEFDVAVTVGETKKEGGGAGISVIGIGGGGLHTTTERQSANASRIKLTVPVILPAEPKAAAS